MNMHNIKRQIIGSALALMMIAQTSVEVFAGSVNIGTSGTVTSTGAYGNGDGVVALGTPSFKVSLYRNPKVLLEPENGHDIIKEKMKNTFPSNTTGPVYFLAPAAYSAIGGKGVTIASADTGSKSLRTVADSNTAKNVIGISSGSASSVYYDQLVAKGKDGLVGSGWKTIPLDVAKSESAWSGILSSASGIQNRIDAAFNPEKLDFNNVGKWTDEQRTSGYMHYLDMLMTLYTVSGGTSKSAYEQAINDYVNSANLIENPISICFESVAVMTIKGQIVLVPSIDYIEFVSGTETMYSMRNEAWENISNSPFDTYAQIIQSVQASVDASPTFPRITDGYTATEGFSHGRSAMTTNSLYTTGGIAHWRDVSISAAYLNVFELQSGQYGFMLDPAPLVAPVSNKIKFTAEPDNAAVDSETIGQEASLKIHSNADQKMIGEWEQLLKGKKTVEVIVSTVNDRGLANTYVKDPAKTVMTPSQFMGFIKGTEDIIYNHTATAAVKIAPSSTYIINYTMTMVVRVDGKEYSFGTLSDPASWVRQKKRKYFYTSKPEAWSELKDNLPTKENWEAMAGVPSTEQLYFAAGGSEFIVDIELDYVQNEVAKRTYHSYFGQVECEFMQPDKMPVINIPNTFAPTEYSDISVSCQNGDWVVTATWTGEAWECSGPEDDKIVHVDNPQHAKDYQNAQKWAAYLGSGVKSTLTFTNSGSDKKTRATVFSVSGPPSMLTPNHKDCSGGCKCDCETDHKNKPCPHKAGSACSNTTYTYTVTGTMKAHEICGPCCEHTLLQLNDTWAQTFKYDSFKIKDVHVWKIDEAIVDGMNEITNYSDTFIAKIHQGDPNIFYNIALKQDPAFVAQDGRGGATGTSKAGRVRYTLDPDQNDEVTYNNGTRNNFCDGLATTVPANVVQAGGKGHEENWAKKGIVYDKTGKRTPSHFGYQGQYWMGYPTDYEDGKKDFEVENSDSYDKATQEYKVFQSQRNAKNTVIMVTDFLVLQTSSGDQSVMYFDKKGPTVNSDQPFYSKDSKPAKMEIEDTAMWSGNNSSASTWKKDHINVGSYNGKYTEVPTGKYTWTSKGKTAKTESPGTYHRTNPGMTYSQSTMSYQGPASNVTLFEKGDPAVRIDKIARPTQPLRLYCDDISIKRVNRNKSYITGEAQVFFENLLHWTEGAGNQLGGPYVTATQNDYQRGNPRWPTGREAARAPTLGIPPQRTDSQYRAGDAVNANGGHVMKAPYGPGKSKINDIIVHDPVSTEDAIIIALPEERDQRSTLVTGSAQETIDNINKYHVCPENAAECDFRLLRCKYDQREVLASFNFDTTGTKVTDSITKKQFTLPSGFNTSGGVLNANGVRWGISLGDLKDGVKYTPGIALSLEADVTINQSAADTMLFSFYSYDFYIPANQGYATINTGNSWELKTDRVIADGRKHKIKVVFSFESADQSKVYIDGAACGLARVNASSNIDSGMVGNFVYIGSWGRDASYAARYTIDNLVIAREAGTRKHTAGCYREVDRHPDGNNAHQHTVACLNGKYYECAGRANTGPFTLQCGYVDVLIYEWRLSAGSNCGLDGMLTWSVEYPYELCRSHDGCGTASAYKTGNSKWGPDPSHTHQGSPSQFGSCYVNPTVHTHHDSALWYHYGPGGSGQVHPSTSSTYCTSCGSATGWYEAPCQGFGGQWFVDRFNGGGMAVEKDFSYTGSVQTYTVESTGTYKLEVWGAQGGGTGGLGGYSQGTISVKRGDVLSVYVGGAGALSRTGGWNGGGSTNNAGAGGGGGTDIRLNGQSMYDRVIVAGGGGGSGPRAGGNGGDTNGLNGTAGCGMAGAGGTQSSGGAGGGANNGRADCAEAGGFGYGGNDTCKLGYNGHGGGAGGGGWYGGGAGSHDDYYNRQDNDDSGGGGGSGYIGKVTGGSMQAGVQSGSGKAKITPVTVSIGGDFTEEEKRAMLGKAYDLIMAEIEAGGGSSIAPGTKYTFGFTGNVQYWTAPASGTYKIDVYGGQGGNYIGGGYSSGAGGTASGTINVKKGQIYQIFVGGKGGDSNGTAGAGGWNGGGSGIDYHGGGGGGKTHLSDPAGNILIAAGGGGASGHRGGGLPGGGVLEPYGSGGQGNRCDNMTASGGSSYIGGVNGGTWTTGGNFGNGVAYITAVKTGGELTLDMLKKYWHLIPNYLDRDEKVVNPIWGCKVLPLNIHICNSNCYVERILACQEPHHNNMHYDGSNEICWDACMNDLNHKFYKPEINFPDGTKLENGKFINMDWGYQIYFPNIGDFDKGEPYGIGSLTSQNGLGLVDRLDTGTWTRIKRVRFQWNVIYNGKMYLAGEWITLGDKGIYAEDTLKYSEAKWSNYGTREYNDIYREYYSFYCVLANYEAKSALGEFEVEAINCPNEGMGPNDNKITVSNKDRSEQFMSLHGGYKQFFIDVVGRIGNLVIDDTTDYRFSNFFKLPIGAKKEKVDGSVYTLADGLALRGNAVKLNPDSLVEDGNIHAYKKDSGAIAENITIEPGKFRIDINGSGLGQGELKVYSGSTDWTGYVTESVQGVINTNRVYYLDAPSQTSALRIEYNNTTATDAKITRMYVTSIELAKLGDTVQNWIVEGIIQEVNPAIQNNYISWVWDMRGRVIGDKTHQVNTHDALTWSESAKRVVLPLSPGKNDKEILKKEPLGLGYEVMYDVSTIGNYWGDNSSQIQIIPYYFALDISKAKDGEFSDLIPIDIYMMADNQYKIINEFGFVDKDWSKKQDQIYPFVYNLNWLEEKVRRNYSDKEQLATDTVRDTYSIPINVGGTITGMKKLDVPVGEFYSLGTAQFLASGPKSRTFVGGNNLMDKNENILAYVGNKPNDNFRFTGDDPEAIISGYDTEWGNNYNKNPGNRINDVIWYQSNQRWHTKIGLPSSALFVRHGLEPTEVTIKEFASKNYLIIAATDIRVIGDTYILKYDQAKYPGVMQIPLPDEPNQYVDYDIPKDYPSINPDKPDERIELPPVIAIYSPITTSVLDLDINKTY